MEKKQSLDLAHFLYPSHQPSSALQKQSDESPKTSLGSQKKDANPKPTDSPGTGHSLWSTWPRKFALLITVGLICAAAVWIPLLLTNILGKTSTTGNSSLILLRRVVLCMALVTDRITTPSRIRTIKSFELVLWWHRPNGIALFLISIRYSVPCV